MDVSAVKNDIQSKQIQPFYIFAGDEWKVQSIYIQKLATAKQLELKYVDDMQSIYSKLKNKSFVNKSFCYVLRDDKDIMQNEELQQQIDHGLLGDNVLILLLTNLDKRTKFYKHYEDKIVEFKPLSEDILVKYIQKEIDLSTRNSKILAEVCEYNYGRILLEIDKLRSLWKVYPGRMFPDKNYDKIFETCLNDGTIYIPPKDAVFDFVDAVLRHKTALAFELMDECYEVGEATLVMLSVLYNNVKQVLQVQACESKDVAKATGLTGWQIKNAFDKKGVYRNGELVNIMRQIQAIEAGIKKGTIEEDIAMEYLLVSIL